MTRKRIAVDVGLDLSDRETNLIEHAVNKLAVALSKELKTDIKFKVSSHTIFDDDGAIKYKTVKFEVEYAD